MLGSYDIVLQLPYVFILFSKEAHLYNYLKRDSLYGSVVLAQYLLKHKINHILFLWQAISTKNMKQNITSDNDSFQVLTFLKKAKHGLEAELGIREGQGSRPVR